MQKMLHVKSRNAPFARGKMNALQPFSSHELARFQEELAHSQDLNELNKVKVKILLADNALLTMEACYKREALVINKKVTSLQAKRTFADELRAQITFKKEQKRREILTDLQGKHPFARSIILEEDAEGNWKSQVIL